MTDAEIMLAIRDFAKKIKLSTVLIVFGLLNLCYFLFMTYSWLFFDAGFSQDEKGLISFFLSAIPIAAGIGIKAESRGKY